MKKNILLLLSVLLMVPASAQAVNWQQLDTENKEFQLSIDTDSIDFIDETTCVYAVKYSKNKSPNKLVFVKSDFKFDKLGIIAQRDYQNSTYNAKAGVAYGNAYMKPVDDDSFLMISHKFANTIYHDRLASAEFNEKISKDKNIKHISYHKTYIAKDFKEYALLMSKAVKHNWHPPKSGKKTQTIVIVNVDKSGALLGYDIAKSSGDELTDRSAISAIEKSAPFGKFPKAINQIDDVNIQYIFEYKQFRKSVK